MDKEHVFWIPIWFKQYYVEIRQIEERDGKEAAKEYCRIISLFYFIYI